MEPSMIADEFTISEDFDDFINKLKDAGLNVSEGIVSGKRSALVTRPKKGDPSSALHDECTLTIINEDGAIISQALERIYPLGGDYNFMRVPPETEQPMFVEEIVPGTLVTVSKCEHTYVISSKESMHGRNDVAGKAVSTRVMSVLNRKLSIKGIDSLFDPTFNEDYCWIFQLTIDKYNRSNLVLLSVISMETGRELNRGQVDNMAQHYKFDRPVRRIFYGKRNINEAIESLLKRRPNLKRVIIRNQEEDRSIYPVPTHLRIKATKRGSKQEILMLAECAMKGIQVLDSEASNLLQVFRSNMERLADEADTLYKLNKHRRTRAKFAAAVKHHPMSRLLFALRDEKITSLDQMHKVLTSLQFTKMIGRVDGDRLYEAIMNYREEVCQLNP